MNRMSSIPGSFAFADTCVSWVDHSNKKTEGIGISIDYDDILTATTDGVGDDCFRLHFAVHEKKTNKLLKGDSVIHCADQAARDGHVSRLKEKLSLVTCRPKRLLVLINPDSGKKKGESIYRGKIAPLFDLVGIEQDVVITENAPAVDENIARMDRATTDGIIAVGGDGTFLRVVNAVMNAAVTREGGDVVNPPDPLPETHMRIGLIPVGSQCIITELMDGIIDLTTSALRIILGKKNKIDIGTVHQGDGSFLKYFALYFSYGCASVDLHNLGYKSWFSRLPFLSSVGKTPYKTFEATIKWLESSESNQERRVAKEENEEADVAEVAPILDESKDLEGQFSNIAAFVPNLDSIFRPNAPAEVDPNCLMSLVVNSASLSGSKANRRFCQKFSNRDESAFVLEGVQRHLVSRVEIQAKEGGDDLEIVLDGDATPLQSPASIVAKIHRGKINVFSK